MLDDATHKRDKKGTCESHSDLPWWYKWYTCTYWNTVFNRLVAASRLTTKPIPRREALNSPTQEPVVIDQHLALSVGGDCHQPLSAECPRPYDVAPVARPRQRRERLHRRHQGWSSANG